MIIQSGCTIIGDKNNQLCPVCKFFNLFSHCFLFSLFSSMASMSKSVHEVFVDMLRVRGLVMSVVASWLGVTQSMLFMNLYHQVNNLWPFQCPYQVKMINIVLLWLKFAVSEGKRASGLTAVWVARNRFAVLDRTHTVRFWLIFVMSWCENTVGWK